MSQAECCGDLPYFLATRGGSWDEKRNQYSSLIDDLKPRIAIVRRWADALQAMSDDTRQKVLGEYPRAETIFGELIYRLEEFGVWSTNQCIDTHSRPLHCGELTDPLLAVLDEYAATSPVSAAKILQIMADWNSSCWGYNCPEESLVNNSKKPNFTIRLLQITIVKDAFKGSTDPDWVKTQFTRLLTEQEKHCKFREGWSLNFHWEENMTPISVATIWDKHRNDDGYWEKKKEEGSKNAS